MNTLKCLEHQGKSGFVWMFHAIGRQCVASSGFGRILLGRWTMNNGSNLLIGFRIQIVCHCIWIVHWLSATEVKVLLESDQRVEKWTRVVCGCGQFAAFRFIRSKRCCPPRHAERKSRRNFPYIRYLWTNERCEMFAINIYSRIF